jgi:signal transduction histidine kinase
MAVGDTAEKIRLQAVAAHCGFAPAPDSRFLRLTGLACQLFAMPMAMVNIIDGTTVWPVATEGIGGEPVPREKTLCMQVLQHEKPVVLGDLTCDPDYCNNELVTGGPRISFYAGVPIFSDSGHVLGVLCVMDHQPRPAFGDTQVRLLEQLAETAAERLTLDNEQRQARLNLLKMEKALHNHQDFLVKMNREVRDPLNSIVGFAEMLVADRLPVPQREYAELLHETARDLVGVLAAAMDYARLESAGIALDIMDFPLEDIARRSLLAAKRKAPDKSINYLLSRQPGLPATMRSDPMRLQQILGLLLSNAVSFAEKGDIRLDISPGKRPGHLRFSVSDNGPGIPCTMHATLFDPFTPTQTITDRAPKQPRLGLATARYLVSAMGGDIGYQTNICGGATFWFDLPG